MPGLALGPGTRGRVPAMRPGRAGGTSSPPRHRALGRASKDDACSVPLGQGRDWRLKLSFDVVAAPLNLPGGRAEASGRLALCPALRFPGGAASAVEAIQLALPPSDWIFALSVPRMSAIHQLGVADTFSATAIVVLDDPGVADTREQKHVGRNPFLPSKFDILLPSIWRAEL